MNTITIVIITYNSSNTIIPLLKSIDNAESRHYLSKIIIIENNSPDSDKTTKLVKAFATRSVLNIKLINSTRNNGFARSCNQGAKLAESKYVLFLNPDTLIKRNSLRVIYNHAESNQADIIGGVSIKNIASHHNTVVRKPNLFIGLFELTSLGKIFNIHKAHSDFYYEDIENLYASKVDFNADAIGGAYLMVNRDSFNVLGGFDINFFMYLEDVDLGCRANMLGMKVIFCPHSKIYHIGGASSTNKYRIKHQAWYDSRRYFYKKHYRLLTNCILQPIFIIEELFLKVRQHYLS